MLSWASGVDQNDDGNKKWLPEMSEMHRDSGDEIQGEKERGSI